MGTSYMSNSTYLLGLDRHSLTPMDPNPTRCCAEAQRVRLEGRSSDAGGWMGVDLG